MNQQLAERSVNAARSLTPEQARNLEIPDSMVDRIADMTDRQIRVLEERGAAALGTTVDEYKEGQTLVTIRAGAIGLVVVGVTLTVGLKIVGEVGSQINDTAAQQGADDAASGLTELSGFLPIIGLVLAAASVIGLVSGSFGGPRRGDA